MISLRPCACGPEEWVRIQRSFWMRLFRARRLYYCERCKSKLFMRKSAVLALRTQAQVRMPG